jgi:hypothetical protein
VALITGSAEETLIDQYHAAYLAHAANVLPELFELARVVSAEYTDAADWVDDIGRLQKMARAAFAKADEVEVQS